VTSHFTQTAREKKTNAKGMENQIKKKSQHKVNPITKGPEKDVIKPRHASDCGFHDEEERAGKRRRRGTCRRGKYQWSGDSGIP